MLRTDGREWRLLGPRIDFRYGSPYGIRAAQEILGKDSIPRK